MAPSWQRNLLCGVELSCERQIGQNLAIILNLPLLRTKPDKACGGLTRAFELYNNINYSTNNSVNEWGCVCPYFTEQMPGHLSNICSLTVTRLYVGKTHQCLTSFWTTQRPREWWHALASAAELASALHGHRPPLRPAASSPPWVYLDLGIKSLRC